MIPCPNERQAVTLKTLVTGLVTAAAGAAVVAAAAGGVTSIAGAPAIRPVVWDIPLPQAPAPDLAGPLTQTVNTLGSGGSFAGKQSYIQGLGRFTGKGVEIKYNDAVARGFLPLTATVANVDQNGPVATAFVTATLRSGEVRQMPLTFVQGPSPTGWQLSSGSLFDLAGLMG